MKSVTLEGTQLKTHEMISFEWTHTTSESSLPVNCERLACWLLFGHADDTGWAAVGAAQPWAAHTVGPAAYPNALTDLRVIQHVPRVHRQCPSVKTLSGLIKLDHFLSHFQLSFLYCGIYFYKSHKYVCKWVCNKWTPSYTPAWWWRSMEGHGRDPSCGGDMTW